LQPVMNADWWKEFNRDDKKPKVIDQSKIRTLDAEKYPQPTIKKKKNEKRHNKTVRKRRKVIEEKGLYFVDKDKKLSGNLCRHSPTYITEEAYDHIRHCWIRRLTPQFEFFNEAVLTGSFIEVPWLSRKLLSEKIGRVIVPTVLMKEALFCTGKIIKERNDSALPSTIALEVYSVDLGFVFVKKSRLVKYYY